MKKTDMELQAIREKLQLLQAEPPTAEALSLPWSAPTVGLSERSHLPQSQSEPQPASEPTPQPASQPALSSEQIKQSPQAIAIEALKQRSSNQQGTSVESAESKQGAAAYADSLVAQEIYRLEVQAHHINVRSQQQADEIMAMKHSAQQAAIALGRKGVQNHPQLKVLAQFLDSGQSALVPLIEQDSEGHFCLTYQTLDFRSAQQDAISTAQALRQRSVSTSTSPTVFSHPIEPGPIARRKSRLEKTSRPQKPNRWIEQMKVALSPLSKQLSKQLSEQRFEDEGYAATQFSWLDGAIWFSGAAIARIVVEFAVIRYPFLSTPLLIALVGTLVFGIYRIITSKSSDFGPAYRLLIAMLGLFSVGLL
ncbi:MAG: hypothetical protein WBD47_03140 [Phormidesmis sp.]